MLRVGQPPHHVLHAIGGLDDADEQVPVARVETAEDHLRAVFERAVEVLHIYGFVHSAFIERPCRFRPSKRAIWADALVELFREGCG